MRWSWKTCAPCKCPLWMTASHSCHSCWWTNPGSGAWSTGSRNPFHQCTTLSEAQIIYSLIKLSKNAVWWGVLLVSLSSDWSKFGRASDYPTLMIRSSRQRTLPVCEMCPWFETRCARCAGDRRGRLCDHPHRCRRRPHDWEKTSRNVFQIPKLFLRHF